jgi:acetylornithine deacetylase
MLRSYPSVSVESAIDVISRLISFDTESSKSNLDLISWVEAHLKSYEVPYFITKNKTSDKATLCATVGPLTDGGIVLSGHTDVVPVAGQAWTSEPYTLRRADERLFGRGTCDMKAFDAIALAQVPTFLAARMKAPIHIVLSYDEEVTSRGSIEAIEAFGRTVPKPRAVVVGEPTMMQVANAHKSISTYLTTVHGREAHSSKPMLGANANEAACDMVCELTRLARALEADSDPSRRFDPAYSTINVGTINGGTARNILARECQFLWEFRGLPGVPQDTALRHLEVYQQTTVLPRLRRFTDDVEIWTETITEVPGLAPEPDSAAESLALRLSGTSATIAVPFATEAGQFQVRGFPTVLCGPGNVDQAHQPDEFIAIDQVASCLGFMERLAAEMAR